MTHFEDANGYRAEPEDDFWGWEGTRPRLSTPYLPPCPEPRNEIAFEVEEGP